jgi:hypothetical protein
MIGQPPLCMDCLGPPTIQVVSPENIPVATPCQSCFDEGQRFGEAIHAMLDKACQRLTEQAEAEFTGDLSAFRPRGFRGALAKRP